MANKDRVEKNRVEKNSKWGEMFLGEQLVPLFIPPDPYNAQKSQWMAINGQEILLAIGEQLLVPASVAELWQNAHRHTLRAQALMNNVQEISA